MGLTHPTCRRSGAQWWCWLQWCSMMVLAAVVLNDGAGRSGAQWWCWPQQCSMMVLAAAVLNDGAGRSGAQWWCWPQRCSMMVLACLEDTGTWNIWFLYIMIGRINKLKKHFLFKTFAVHNLSMIYPPCSLSWTLLFVTLSLHNNNKHSVKVILRIYNSLHTTDFLPRPQWKSARW